MCELTDRQDQTRGVSKGTKIKLHLKEAGWAAVAGTDRGPSDRGIRETGLGKLPGQSTVCRDECSFRSRLESQFHPQDWRSRSWCWDRLQFAQLN